MSKAPAATPAAAAKVEPYIPASQSLPELTVGVVILGCLLSVILGAANAYLGMFAGMTVSASIPAAVISMAVLRFFGGNILQNNVVQTAAASGEGLASGVIFTVPALVLLKVWSGFSYVETTLIAGFGGILGVLFTIPLRRALIIEHPLQFPEGVATAEVLKVGAEGGGGIKLIMGAALIGAIGKLGSTGLRVWTDIAAYGTTVGKSAVSVGINMSPALLGVGFIVGLNVAAVIFAGAVMDHWIAIPAFSYLGDAASIITNQLDKAEHPLNLAQVLADPDNTVADAADLIHKYATRYLGVGMMLVGGFWALFRLRKSLIGGIKAGLDAYKQGGAGGDGLPRTERDMPMNVILGLIVASVIPLFFIFEHFTGSYGISAVMAVVMLIAGFLFSAVASYMAGLVGSSNNPVSGITISTILVSALLLLGLGMKSPAGPIAAILIGGVVCCAAAIGGDNLQDLKCGQLVGSTPWKQQVMQIIGVVVAAFMMAPILDLLNNSYGIGGKGLPAPQASLMASVAGGVFNGGLPWAIIGIGAGIAVVVICIDLWLEKAGAKFRMPVMAFAVGAYLPFDLTLPIFLGGIIAHMVSRWLDATGADAARRGLAERNGLLAAAGLITGEALLGILLAIPISVASDPNAIALFKKANDKGKMIPQFADARIPGLILCVVVLGFMYWAATRRDEKK
jgi:putative OPT family oligopeptide transporter